jgi:hypothetical protein
MADFTDLVFRQFGPGANCGVEVCWSGDVLPVPSASNAFDDRAVNSELTCDLLLGPADCSSRMIWRTWSSVTVALEWASPKAPMLQAPPPTGQRQMPAGVMPVSLLMWFLVYRHRVAPLRVLGFALYPGATASTGPTKKPTTRSMPTGASYRIKSDDDVVQFAFRWARLVRRQRGVVAIERRAIGAHILNVLAHVAEDMRMVLWRQRTYAHEFLGTDLDDRNARLVVEMRNDIVCHGLHAYTFTVATRLRPARGRPGL